MGPGPHHCLPGWLGPLAHHCGMGSRAWAAMKPWGVGPLAVLGLHLGLPPLELPATPASGRLWPWN